MCGRHGCLRSTVPRDPIWDAWSDRCRVLLRRRMPPTRVHSWPRRYRRDEPFHRVRTYSLRIGSRCFSIRREAICTRAPVSLPGGLRLWNQGSYGAGHQEVEMNLCRTWNTPMPSCSPTQYLHVQSIRILSGVIPNLDCTWTSMSHDTGYCCAWTSVRVEWTET